MLHEYKLSVLLGLMLAIWTCPAVWSQANDECSDNPSRDVDSYGLCKNFQDLRSTIDAAKLIELITSHNQCDVKFRRAMRFVNTTRFRLVANQLEQATAYKTLLKDLRTAGINTTDIDRVVDIFSCLVLPVPQGNSNSACSSVRGHKFIDDLMLNIPHDKVHNYNIKSNITNYALFARTITSPRFQERLQQLMCDRELVRPLRVLRSNYWDIPGLMRAMITILSW